MTPATRRLSRLLYLIRRHPAGRLLTYTPLRRRIRARLGLDATGVGKAGFSAPPLPADPISLKPMAVLP